MKKSNKKINKECFQGNLNFDLYIQIENQIETIKRYIIDIFENNLSFWNLLHQENVNLEELL